MDRSTTFTRWEDAFARYLMAETDERPRYGVLVLITYQNANVSTLGSGHFLCRHVNQSTLLAKVQIGISMGLQDPILELESKYRVNLMYDELQLGKFKNTTKILR
ncbi:hypothetical protein PsorP6_002676 [Peronosclerospora sorghi]|uniref:Uncharacterized protein n=1 Tax=Peronosclerospora sorghi TaxID=230839 RepID=A0ACC0WSJ2_9STRA|nr:hypothetical protein PsorP6_002676 [Peronosclerospora sorghi]